MASYFEHNTFHASMRSINYGNLAVTLHYTLAHYVVCELACVYKSGEKIINVAETLAQNQSSIG